MGGETEAQVSPWTVDSLKEHLESRIDSLEQRLLERQEAQQEAITQVRNETARSLASANEANSKSERQMEERFRSVNEFRGQLNDQVKTFITRDTYDIGHAALVDKVGTLENQLIGLMSEKRGGSEKVNSIYALGAFVVTVIVIGTVLAANGVFK